MNRETTSGASPAIGFIVPSSNRIVERATRRILERVPGMDACFARVPYGGHPADGYDTACFETGAAMLAEARVDVICWNATRGALLGFEPDRRLCDLLEHRTGIPVTTTALATLDLLTSRKLTCIGLIAQGNPEEGQRLVGNLARRGIHVAAAYHLGISDNFEASRVSREQITGLTEQLAANGRLDAVLIWSTNLPGFALAAEMEGRIGIPVLDSTTIGILAALGVAGVDIESAELLDNIRSA